MRRDPAPLLELADKDAVEFAIEVCRQFGDELFEALAEGVEPDPDTGRPWRAWRERHEMALPKRAEETGKVAIPFNTYSKLGGKMRFINASYFTLTADELRDFAVAVCTDRPPPLAPRNPYPGFEARPPLTLQGARRAA